MVGNVVSIYIYFYCHFPTLMNVDFQNRTNMKYSTHGLACCEVSLMQSFNFITVWVFTQAFSIFFLYVPDVLLSAVSSLTMWRKFYYVWSVSVIRLYVLSISSTAIVSLILYFQASVTSLLVFSVLHLESSCDICFMLHTLKSFKCVFNTFW